MLKNITDFSIELKKQKDNSGIRTDLFDGFKGSLFSIIIRIKLKNKFNIDNNNLIIIQKRYFHKSIKNQCYWRALLNRIPNKEIKTTNDIKYFKINKSINNGIKENNIKLFDRYYLMDKKITKFQYDALLANNNKEYLALQHPLVCIKSNNDFLCMAETSYKVGNIKRSLILEEILKGDISVFHKADKLTIKELNGKYYVLAFRKFYNDEGISLFKELDELKVLSVKEIDDFNFFFNENFDILKKNEINMNNYYNPENLLKILADYNVENNLINEENLKKKSVINLSNINKGSSEI